MIIRFLKRHKYESILVLLCTLTYLPSFFNQYSDDDWRTAGDNELVQQGIKGIPKIFTTHYTNNQDPGNKPYSFEYRPIAKSTFALEYQLFGRAPQISHILNFLLYLAVLFLLYQFLIALQINQFDAWLILLVFALHTLHVESVANLKNRETLLGVFLSLGAWRWTKLFDQFSYTRLLAYCFLLAIATWCKADALPLLFIIPLSYIWLNNYPLKRGLGIVLLSAFVSILTITLLPKLIVGDYVRSFLFWENPLFADNSLLFNLETSIKTIGWYIAKALLPLGLMHYYGYNCLLAYQWLTLYFIVGLIGIIAAIFLVIRYHKNDKKIVWAIAWSAATLFSFSNIVSYVPGIVADRHAFLFILGYAACLVWGLRYLLQGLNKAKYLNYLLIIYALMLGLLSHWRCYDWYSYYSLYTSSLPHANSSTKANTMAANQYMVRANKLWDTKHQESIELYEKAYSALQKSIEIYPTMEGSWNNLGYIESLKGNETAARNNFKKEITYNPSYIEAYMNLAASYINEKKYTDALDLYKYVYEHKNTFNGNVINAQFIEEFKKLAELSNDTLAMKIDFQ